MLMGLVEKQATTMSNQLATYMKWWPCWTATGWCLIAGRQWDMYYATYCLQAYVGILV